MMGTQEFETAAEGPIRARWLSVDEAEREIDRFQDRFGPKALYLASHAAVPLLLSPELVHLIRVNFVEEFGIPPIAEADLLLSSLCRPMDEPLFEMEPRVREILLEHLPLDFGPDRPFRMARFLLNWLKSRPENARSREESDAHEWVYNAWLRPEETVEKILLDFKFFEENNQRMSLFRLLKSAEALAIPFLVFEKTKIKYQSITYELRSYVDEGKNQIKEPKNQIGLARKRLKNINIGELFNKFLYSLNPILKYKRQVRFIKQAFAQYLSPELIEELVREPERLKLGGEQRPLSIFFSSLDSFTSIAERMRPFALAELLNRYLTEMTDIILFFGGTVDKYEGDTIIAFWNAPTEQREHPARAVRAAMECQRRIAELRPEFRKHCGKDLRMRIGLNSGVSYVGNFGSTHKFNYTILGEAVNLAARLERVNKIFGTYTLVSAVTQRLADKEFAYREVGRVQVSGLKEAATVYEPMFQEEFEKNRMDLEMFQEALFCFYNGSFNSARDHFASIADRDPVAVRYLERLSELGEEPPEGWSGLLVLDR